MERVSTDATRKIATLRKWAENPASINPAYLAEIASEFERVHNIMVERGEILEMLKR